MNEKRGRKEYSIFKGLVKIDENKKKWNRETRKRKEKKEEKKMSCVQQFCWIPIIFNPEKQAA